MKKQNLKKKDFTAREDMANEQFKLVICIIALCILMGVLLYAYNSTIPDKLIELGAEKDMEHTEWFVRYASLLPPVILAASLLTLFYSNKDKYVPVKTQRQKAWITGIVAGFTYIVLLGYTLLSSPEWYMPAAQRQDGSVTMFENTSSWFFAQIIPFLILVSYHIIRASSEEKELLENEKV